ncbi:unnamed protein product [Clonostachys rosea]|uniref:Uncharacterized protein n=1 Tax=Bionectria ochroleuca TaxID=29856 RepID=A0ABY6V1Y9_BIOOC|nr:unnamed protein product [Clonostachys rosea]
MSGIPNLELSGKVALVTGGCSGIGLECVRILAARGASVAILDLAEGSRMATELSEQFSTTIRATLCDVTSHKSVAKAAQWVESWAGRLDFCVNAAGIFPPQGKDVAVVDPETWKKVMDVNVNGTFYCLQQELQIMKRLGCKGSIVNISSDAGAVATAGHAAYVASKHAINGLTKTASLENAREGIRINAVAPGFIDTPLMDKLGVSKEQLGKEACPVGRCGKPQEVAELIAFLLSEKSSFMTGSIVAIDGGATSVGFCSGL